MFSRESLGKAAKELADHLQLVEHIRSLQIAQKDLAEAVGKIDARLRELETSLRVAKSEIQLEAIKETQNIINSVQGGLNQRIEDIAIKVALYERDSEAKSGRLLNPKTNRLASKRVHDVFDGTSLDE